MGAKFIMQYIAKVSGGGPSVQVRHIYMYIYMYMYLYMYNYPGPLLNTKIGYPVHRGETPFALHKL